MGVSLGKALKIKVCKADFLQTIAILRAAISPVGGAWLLDDLSGCATHQAVVQPAEQIPSYRKETEWQSRVIHSGGSEAASLTYYEVRSIIDNVNTFLNLP